MKLKNIVLMVVLMGIFSFLFGCGKNNKPINVPIENPAVPAETQTVTAVETESITSMKLPDGAKLTGLYLSHQGMARMPYYIMKTTENGTFMKISDLSPDAYEMWKDDDTDDQVQPAEYFGFIETVKDVEYASLVCLEDETLIRKMEEIVETYGVLAWDGFHESVSMPGVLDSGDSYNLYLELSDGTTVTMDGYNTAPKGFDDFYSEIIEVFHSNSDYSRYLVTDFSASPCIYLEVELREKEYSDVYYLLRLRAQNNQWSVILTDPVGAILEKGTDISDYGEIEESLPYDRFLSIMSKYDMESWNQYDERESTPKGDFDITMYFEDGKEFSAHGNVYPKNFEAFKEEFVREIYEYYKGVSGDS